MFATFYAYKGGVGRSLALANVACLLAEDEEHPQKVLLWDFDVEAPGLHRLFPPKHPQKFGFVDMVTGFPGTSACALTSLVRQESTTHTIRIVETCLTLFMRAS